MTRYVPPPPRFTRYQWLSLRELAEQDVDMNGQIRNALLRRGMIEMKQGDLRLTPLGWKVAHAVSFAIAAFVAEHADTLKRETNRFTLKENL